MIQVKNLTKKFNDILAVDNISFSVGKGEIFAFLGPILGAFVEEDKKGFEKKKNSEQMSVLAAGTFANVIFALIFFGLYVGFFFTSFAPAGYIFNTYSVAVIPASQIFNIEEIVIGEKNFTSFSAENKTYFLDDSLTFQLEEGREIIAAYDDAPAVRAGLKGAIVQMNDFEIKGIEDLQKFMEGRMPGEEVRIRTWTEEGGFEDYEIVLGEHPLEDSQGYLGVGFSRAQPRGIIQRILAWFMGFKEPSTYSLSNASRANSSLPYPASQSDSTGDMDASSL